MMCTRCGFESASEMRFCGRCGSPLTDAERRRGRSPTGPSAGISRCCSATSSARPCLPSRLDPEDFRDLLSGYHAACTKAVERYGGYLAQFQGDGVIAYFGYPQAHEDDAARAVTTGLEVVDGIADLNARLEPLLGVSLQVRVGHRQRHRDNGSDRHRPGARAALRGRRRPARRGARADGGATRNRRRDRVPRCPWPVTSRRSRSARTSSAASREPLELYEVHRSESGQLPRARPSPRAVPLVGRVRRARAASRQGGSARSPARAR